MSKNFTEQELLLEIDEFISQIKPDYVSDLATLIACNSLQQEPSGKNAPYGKGVRASLDAAMQMGNRLGLAMHECDGYMAWAELAGEQSDYIATITHLDIVPIGEGWNSDPFTLTEKDGWLIGRGTADDKGPAALTLYAAKFFSQHKIPLRYTLRVLLGCNEETGMTDVDYYLSKEAEPLFCFTPDADFPVSYAEKGIYSANFTSAVCEGNILDFSAGFASNVIPDKAQCTVKADASTLPTTENVDVRQGENGCAILVAKGIGGHAAHPENTCNAIGLLVNYLLEQNLCAPCEKPFFSLLQQLHSATDGSGLGIACRDDIFDPLTCIGGMLRKENGSFVQNINIRFPTSTSAKALTEKLTALVEATGGTFAADRADEPFHISPDSAPIQTLLQSYKGVTGSNKQPYTMGGGTYARHFASAAAFGPSDSDTPLPSFVGAEHAANEGVNLDSMMRALKIYILALWRLQKLDF